MGMKWLAAMAATACAFAGRAAEIPVSHMPTQVTFALGGAAIEFQPIEGENQTPNGRFRMPDGAGPFNGAFAIEALVEPDGVAIDRSHPERYVVPGDYAFFRGPRGIFILFRDGSAVVDEIGRELDESTFILNARIWAPAAPDGDPIVELFFSDNSKLYAALHQKILFRPTFARRFDLRKEAIRLDESRGERGAAMAFALDLERMNARQPATHFTSRTYRALRPSTNGLGRVVTLDRPDAPAVAEYADGAEDVIRFGDWTRDNIGRVTLRDCAAF